MRIYTMKIFLTLCSIVNAQMGFDNMLGNQPGIQLSNNQPQQGFGNFGMGGNGGIQMGNNQQGDLIQIIYTGLKNSP